LVLAPFLKFAFPEVSTFQFIPCRFDKIFKVFAPGERKRAPQGPTLGGGGSTGKARILPALILQPRQPLFTVADRHTAGNPDSPGPSAIKNKEGNGRENFGD